MAIVVLIVLIIVAIPVCAYEALYLYFAKDDFWEMEYSRRASGDEYDDNASICDCESSSNSGEDDEAPQESEPAVHHLIFLMHGYKGMRLVRKTTR